MSLGKFVNENASVTYFCWFVSPCPASIYLLRVNNRNTKKRCEICSKLTIKTPERRQWHCSVVFIVNFEHTPHLVLVFLLLTLNMQVPAWRHLNPLMQDISKWLDKLSAKHCTANAASFLKCVLPL